MPPSKTYCPLPFSHLFLSEEGKSFPCCYTLESGAVNRDEDGNPMMVTDRDSLQAAWNSPTMRELRKELLAGKEPNACARCFSIERHGMQSLRQISLDRFTPSGKTRSDGSMDLDLLSIDLRLGNLCNLKCQMCSPVSSVKMIDDFKRLYPNSDGEFEKYRNLDWFKNPEVLEMILDHSSSMREIHFAGGEPFLIKEVYDFIRRLAKLPHSSQIRLSFNSNLTILPEPLFSLFRNFDGVRLIGSIDGVGDVNDYIRYPSQFHRIEKNLREMQGRKTEWNLQFVCFNITVQMHNILYLTETIQFLNREFSDFLPFPVLSPLHVPNCLSIQVLPAHLKSLAKEKLELFLVEETPYWKSIEHRDPNPNGAERFSRHVKGIIDFMMAEDHTDLLPEFWRFSSEVENIRGKKLPVPGLTEF